jgi:hypothetical protein
MQGDRKHLVTSLLEHVRARVSLFADPNSEPYAELRAESGGHVLRLRAGAFRAWLDRVAYEETGSVPTSDVRNQVLSVLVGEAIYDAPRRRVHVRLAEHEGAIWVDLGGPDRHAVRIDAHGWTLACAGENESASANAHARANVGATEDAGTPHRVAFVRPATLRPVAAPCHAARAPRPFDRGPLDALRALVPQLDDPAFILFVGWMLGALRPRGPYPLLVLQGERGSGKSTLARVVKILLDASVAPLRAMPKSERDLAISTSRAWISVYDNLAPISTPVSDALCRVSTGGGLATRKLFTDDDEIVHDVCRPIVLTGIEDLATRPDLLEQSIVLCLSPLSAYDRREEAEILRELEAGAPTIFGALLDGVACALAASASRAASCTSILRGSTPAGDAHDTAGPLPRMADFARWVSDAEPALGWDRGRFLRAYALQQRQSDHVVLDDDPVAPLLVRLPRLAESGRWEGTASEMWHELLALLERDSRPKPVGWPRSAHRLASHLRSLAPVLRAHGIDFASERTATSRLLVLTRRTNDGSGAWPTLTNVRATA